MSQSITARIAEIQEEIRRTPYHKATEHHIGRLKAQVARLREQEAQSGAKKAGGGQGYAVRQDGDATVVLVGPPSVGKSTLINRLSNAQSRVAAYDFTTLGVVPGMLDYQGAKIQIFDLPGIVTGAAQGRGRGREVLSVARSADLIVIMVDVKTTNLIQPLWIELYQAGLRLDEQRPNLLIKKLPLGGVKVNTTASQQLSVATIKSLANEFRLTNAEITLRENLSLDRLIDAFLGNRVYLPYLLVINKVDLDPDFDLADLPLSKPPLFISAERNQQLEELKKAIWQTLRLARLYLKKNDLVDHQTPHIFRLGENLQKIGQDLRLFEKVAYARAKISGPGAKFPGQEVSLSFAPVDETVVQYLA